MYWTTCTITACEPGREFTFTVGQGPKALNTWRYVLEPAGDGTDVTESFELADKPAIRLYWKVLGPLRGKTNDRFMRATLEAVKADLEAGAGPAGRPGG